MESIRKIKNHENDNHEWSIKFKIPFYPYDKIIDISNKIEEFINNYIEEKENEQILRIKGRRSFKKYASKNISLFSHNYEKTNEYDNDESITNNINNLLTPLCLHQHFLFCQR